MTATDRVKQSIIDQIRTQSCKPGDCLPGLRKLAEMHQASTGSVRNALRDLAHTGLVEMVQGKGTYVAHGASMNRVTGAKIGNILVVMPRTPAVEGLRAMALEHGLLMSYYETSEDRQNPGVEKRLLEMALENHYRGVILTATPKQPTNEALFAKLRRAGTKVLLTGRYAEKMVAEDALLPDFKTSARVGATRLALAGYRHFTCLDLSDDSHSMPRRLAYRGFREAVADLELDATEPLFHAHGSPELRAQFIDRLKALPAQTGVLCYSEPVAQNLLQALEKVGRSVPEEVGVLCVDCIYGYKSNSRITRMKFDLDELVQRALAIIIDEENGAESVRMRYVRATFVPGATTIGG